MCGILGILASHPVSLEDAAILAMRDRMTHRGPDSAGLWRSGPAVLAHRRLAVIDTSDAAAQPMHSADGRFSLVYNGELYNDAELRTQLQNQGAVFTNASDTQTVLQALIRWGPTALGRFRGMYALGFYDSLDRSLLLARDPLGIKPLYYTRTPTRDGPTLIFASEPPAILAHPDVTARPDLVAVSAYLTTIRTVMGERTLFDGIRTLRPGQALMFEADQSDVRGHAVSTGRSEPAPSCSDDPGALAAAVADSVLRHLRSDVPLCCLLSGGLDSSIVASIAMKRLGLLNTFCSGAEGAAGDDFHFARRVADHLSTRHTEAPVTREMFKDRWPQMVRELGTPLSTPNEIAINHIASRLRQDGNIVTLSGEGADELFAGYDIPMLDAARFEGLLPRDPTHDAPWAAADHPGEFQLLANAWVSLSAKSALLNDQVWRAVEGDHALVEFYRNEFEAIAGEREDDGPLQAHLRFLRRINLAGLLQRFDTATMLASVEGRTPFADRILCDIAESLPLADKFRFSTSPAGPAETKRILRLAFAADLPPEVVSRPKASFPLPFQTWVADHAQTLHSSDFAQAIFTPAAIQTVASDPGRAWQFAWPMINLAFWGDRWWG